MKCMNRPEVGQLSSYFPIKRDGVAITEDQDYLRMQRNGVTVEPLNFPATQSVLWNRTPQGETETLHLTTKRNVRLHINEKTLRLAHRHVSQSKSSFECFLVGSISVDSREDSIDVTVDRFDPGREVLANNGSARVKRKVPTTVVPGDHIVPMTLTQGLSGADSSVTHTKEEFQKAFEVLFGRISNQEPIDISHLVSLKISCHSHGGDDEIIINVNCGTITMAIRIQATPVAPVPIIPTALARNLSGPLRLSEVQGMPKSGYLTMDHTRKLLLLLESDPKALSLPLLGIWVSGIYSIHHPFIWACCLRFIHSTAIQQRVLAPPNSFLLLLYSPVKSTPEFWECQQDQGESEVKMFEFYSCYENLHLEIPPGPSSSDPLCFELFPAPGGIGRSLFEEALEIWGKEHKQSRLDGNGISPNQPQVMTLKKGPGEEDPSPEPRPSPSPHPQNLQFVLPDVAETSLSLSFDEQPVDHSEQDYTNQQIFPHPRPKPNQQQEKAQKEPQQRKQLDQENGQMRPQGEISPGFVKGKERIKQLRNNASPQNSPSREPLKQILAPNQTHAKVISQTQKQLLQKPHSRQVSVVQKVPSQKGSKPGHNIHKREENAVTAHSIPRSKTSESQASPKGTNVKCGTESTRDQQTPKLPSNDRVRTRLQDCNGVDVRPFPQQMISKCQDGETRPRQLSQQQTPKLPSNGKGRARPQHSNGVDARQFPQQVISSNCPKDETRPRQLAPQQFVRQSDHQMFNKRSFPLPVDQMQRPLLETVFEGETPDGTLNKTMDETELERHITGMSEISQSPLGMLQAQKGLCITDSETYSDGSDGLMFDQNARQRHHGYQRNTENKGERSTKPLACEKDGHRESLDNTAAHASEERLDKVEERISEETMDNKTRDSSGINPQQQYNSQKEQSNALEENNNDGKHEGSFPVNKQVTDVSTGQTSKSPADEVTRPDPYELLIRQEAQLRQLQEQIKLLLQQQNAPLPTPNAPLTPPRTPQFESSHGNHKPLEHSPVSMVTACTNTGASLLLGTPLKPSGKKSAATSPMKENELKLGRRSLPSSSTETSQHNSKESQRHDSTVNPEELTNQVLELDDPSQTLASSLHAVDIPSFVESPSGLTSPSPADQTNRGGMETSFTSPVLGESASILVEQREKEGESHNTEKDEFTEETSVGKKSNHVSLLQRNERQFYDNLLDQVKNILDQQVQEDPASLEKPSHENQQKAHVSVHEPTREEVMVATMKELERIKDLTLGTANMESSKSPFSAKPWHLHRSASLSAIPDHPHINYMSFSVDETLDEVFNEADLKYLTDTQLQELRQISNHRKNHSRERAVTFSVLQEERSVLSRKGSLGKDHLCDSSSLTAIDYTWNNLSMATKEYLGKYCLAPRQLGNPDGEKCDAAKDVSDISHGRTGLQTSVTSQGCSAPPSTPEPANRDGSDSQILDITRLKKLPKLF